MHFSTAILFQYIVLFEYFRFKKYLDEESITADIEEELLNTYQKVKETLN